MTTDQLQAYRDAAAAAKARADKATPGPWCIWEGPRYVGGGADLCIGAGGDKWLANMDHREIRCPQIFENGHKSEECDICSIDADGVTNEQRANAVLLSSCRNDIPTLADAVAELAAEVERLQDACAKGAAIIHNIADGSEYARGREDERKAVVAYVKLAYGSYADWIVQRIELGEHVAEVKDE